MLHHRKTDEDGGPETIPEREVSIEQVSLVSVGLRSNRSRSGQLLLSGINNYIIIYLLCIIIIIHVYYYYFLFIYLTPQSVFKKTNRRLKIT